MHGNDDETLGRWLGQCICWDHKIQIV